MTTPVFNLPAKPSELIVTAVIIRKDGTRESLGVVAYWHKNPLRRLAHRILTILTSLRSTP